MITPFVFVETVVVLSLRFCGVLVVWGGCQY